MRIAVTGDTPSGRVFLAWSNESDTFDDCDHERGYRIAGSDRLVQRCIRAAERGSKVGGFTGDLTTPHGAYRTMVGVLREYGVVNGPIDLAATDDDGLPVDFIAEPDAASKTPE